MSEAWVSGTLGSVANIQQGKTLAVKNMKGGEHPVYGANGVIGFFTQGTYDFATVALGCRGSCGTVHIAPAGSFLANNVMGIWPIDAEVVSVEFLALVLEAADLTSTGVISGQVQPQITRSSLTQLPVSLPPVVIQRRIVDLMAHLDNQLTNVIAEEAACSELLARIAIERLELPSEDGVPIASLLSRNIGGVWGEPVGDGEVPVDVYRSTEFTDWGYLSSPAGARRDVTMGQAESRSLAPGDILIEKSGGTPTRSVGRVVRVSASDLVGPSIGANFLQLIRANAEVVLPDYLFWVLWASHRRGDAFEFQQASTNIRNLKTQGYLGRRIRVPDQDTQASLAACLNAALLCLQMLETERSCLEHFREVLLASLLSGQLAIPTTYDLFVTEAA